MTGQTENRDRLAVYGIRYWPKRTRKWTGDIDRGAYSVLVEIPGCNLACAHCFVEDDILRGRKNSEALAKKLAKLPPGLRVSPQHISDICGYAVSLFNPQDRPERVVELTSGEPTLAHPATLVAMAGILKADGVILGINTNGIRADEVYLDRLSEARDNIRFLVSLRDFYSREAFLNFTGMDLRKFPQLRNDENPELLPFRAAQKIVQAGFEQPDLGVTLDTIAAKPETVPERIEQLFSLVEQYGLDSKRLIWDGIKYRGGYGRELPSDRRMKLRGYNRENTNAVKKAAIEYLVTARGVRRDQIR